MRCHVVWTIGLLVLAPALMAQETPNGAPETTEFVWIDDAVPAGANLQGNSPWEFVGKPHPVYSGEKSMRRSAQGISQHFFSDATCGLKIGDADRLFAYVYLDPENPPKTIMLQFNDGTSQWEHRAFWGDDSIPWGTANSPARHAMGPLPKAGEWVRLEVNAADVDLKPGAILSGWAFTQCDGTVYWDKAGSVTGSEPSVAEQIQAVENELTKKRLELWERYNKDVVYVKSDEDRRGLKEYVNRRSSNFTIGALQSRADATAKYLAIVNQYPDDEAILPALQWLVSIPEHAPMAHALMLKNHFDNPEIGKLCLASAHLGGTVWEKVARAVVEKSNSHEAKGTALLALGQMLLARAKQEGDADQRDKLQQNAVEALRDVERKYAEVDAGRAKAGDVAHALLFEFEQLQIGKKVPDLEGQDLKGKAIKLSDFRGKVVFLDFWTHSSEGCVAMFPHERSLVKRMADRRFALIGVNGDPAGDGLNEKNKAAEITWRSFQNKRGEGQMAIADEWNLQDWPTLYLIDYKGTIRQKWLGSPGDEVLDKEIDALVEEADAEAHK